MIHVVIPAAGNGRRFVEAGYGPKTHVPVDGVPMLRRVVENLRSEITVRHHVTVVATAETPDLGGDVEVIRLGRPTRGAVETIDAARLDYGPLMIANCDQLIAPRQHIGGSLPRNVDGCVWTFESDRPHHSYVQVGDDGFIAKIAEKQVISDRAVVGLYLFRDAADFQDAADAVLDRDDRVLGEFYVSTVIAEMVERGLKLCAWPLNASMIGTPEELDAYHARSR